MTALNYRFGYRYFIARKAKQNRQKAIKQFFIGLALFGLMFILAGLNNA